MNPENKLIAREKEAKLLLDLVSQPEPQMISLYGRRRIGKTFLVRSLFKSNKKNIYFETTGLKRGSKKEQLEIFTKSVSQTFYEGVALATPKSWINAFELLDKSLDKVNKTTVLFFDELPWMAHKRQELVDALEHLWNTKWEMNPKIKIVLCGSATSWMIENIVNNKGGLHNRITKIIHLKPFNLAASKKFLISRLGDISNQLLLELYMAFGGVPHYLKGINRGESATQAINRLCFSPDGLLFNEYEKLFDSLFSNSEEYKKIINAIATKRYGLSREELTKIVKTSSGGTLSKKLIELEESGFIWSFKTIGPSRTRSYYRLLDPYILFYLNWIDKIKNSRAIQKNYWLLQKKSGAYHVWSGYAFELTCFQHYEQIATALGISEIPYQAKTYLGKNVQTDLLFDREDNSISLCEIKYSEKQLAVDKSLASELKKRLEVFGSDIKTNKDIFLALITPLGIKKSIWTEGLVDAVVNLEDLMRR